jgi:hypothetical protein
MLQELATNSGASSLAVASMLFFIAVYAVVAFRTFRARTGDLDARARLPLEDDRGAPAGSTLRG